jgi:hypothetical protein
MIEILVISLIVLPPGGWNGSRDMAARKRLEEATMTEEERKETQ